LCFENSRVTAKLKRVTATFTTQPYPLQRRLSMLEEEGKREGLLESSI
jgi:hypothetical protein